MSQADSSRRGPPSLGRRPASGPPMPDAFDTTPAGTTALPLDLRQVSHLHSSRSTRGSPMNRDVGGVRALDAARPGGGPMIARLFATLHGLLGRRRIDGEIA